MGISVTCLKLSQDQCKETLSCISALSFVWKLLERQGWEFWVYSFRNPLTWVLCVWNFRMVSTLKWFILRATGHLFADGSFASMKAVGHHKKCLLPAPCPQIGWHINHLWYISCQNGHHPFIPPFAVALQLLPWRDKVYFTSFWLVSGLTNKIW